MAAWICGIGTAGPVGAAESGWSTQALKACGGGQKQEESGVIGRHANSKLAFAGRVV